MKESFAEFYFFLVIIFLLSMIAFWKGVVA